MKGLDEILKPAVHLSSHVVSEQETDPSFLDRAKAIGQRIHSAVLMSGGCLDCSRYCLACWNPLAVLSAKGHRVRLELPTKAHTFRANPFHALDDFLKLTTPTDLPAPEPFAGGAVGYLAYELKNTLERLPQTARDDLNLPDMYLFIPGDILVYDRASSRTIHIRFALEDQAGTVPEAPWGPSVKAPDLVDGVGQAFSDFSHGEYLRAVAAIRRYIRQGHVYQVNLSQRFTAPFAGDPWRFWTALFQKNPAPFFAHIHAPGHRVLSTSMERFLYRRGDLIETRPIKGTRPRGKTAGEDAENLRDLIIHPKDDAELSMIVDLLRNDLGRVCRRRSVVVRHHKKVESYENVHHLISIVEGRLKEGTTHGQVLRATFPGGSITGCPKIRAMEIIDELEKHVRHVYTGSIGYLGWHENMDLNIAIRTAILKDGMLHLAVGGGVVYDSDEEAEYQETLHKGRTFFHLLKRWERETGGDP
ncbi:para-aminobenzoate synthetase component 1 [Desulfacinum hydrothermale DSM 13146]|uniref:aminodeoxychorismate synthase n=1 Tax=Desulfacinum hydrothermale DSM 13146 TaxID=1121390 RepID=A0A1W1X245_9BACT|nr:aminodeoxychorismate synthase component I [Desulfacinum hydrothermale]SMC18036.1 para-aminobenzoate synthetase component 1 [Desulfacinum hydrothermale DSM 13146]